jgi:hypothetical protein
VSRDLQRSPRMRSIPVVVGDAPPVWCHVVAPEVVNPDARLTVVMHGVLRNGSDYARRWAPFAARGDRVVLAPEFDALRWRGARGYNLGNVMDGTALNPPQRWAFTVLEGLCDAVRERFALRDGDLDMFGHSAGAQFVHRFLLFRPDAPVRRAIAAGAGWYTAPDRSAPWPYGLGHPALSFTDADLARYAARDVVLVRGSFDIHHDSNLRTSPHALAQGANRYERAAWMFEQVRRVDPASRWRLVDVPGVGHDDSAVAPTAWELLVDRATI